MRGIHWGQGYNRPTGCSVVKAPHATFKFFLALALNVTDQLHVSAALALSFCFAPIFLLCFFLSSRLFTAFFLTIFTR